MGDVPTNDLQSDKEEYGSYDNGGDDGGTDNHGGDENGDDGGYDTRFGPNELA